MKRIGSVLLILAAVLSCAGLAGYVYLTGSGRDAAGPVIHMNSESIEISISDPREQLLSGVTATDLQDGNVTDSLVVEGISTLRSDHTAVVTYAAFDSANNVSKAQREVVYTDYQSPTFSLEAPLLFAAGHTVDVFELIHAEDVIDGSLDSRIKATLVSGESSLSEVGTHEVSFRVTNSMGDTVSLVLPVEVYEAGAYSGTLTLSDYLIYLEQGASFRPRAYLETFQAGRESITLETSVPLDVRLEIEGEVDTAQPGVYSVTYITEKDGYRGISRLIVVVEETDAAE